MPSKLSEAELSKYRSTIYGLSAHVGHVPRMHLGRNKWHMAAGFSENTPAAIPLSPEAVETARRAYSAGDQSRTQCSRSSHLVCEEEIHKLSILAGQKAEIALVTGRNT